MDLTRERSNVSIDIEAMRRTWADLNGLNALTIDEIESLKDQMLDAEAYPTMDTYYMNREEKMDDATRRVCILIEFLIK
jgi:hypothetical protein